MNLKKKEPEDLTGQRLVPRSIFQVILMTLGIVFIASNLRAPITAVGPVIIEISDYLGLTNVLAGMLTTIPLLAFAVLSNFAPRLAKRFGMELVLLISLAVLMIGLVVRPLGNIPFLFIGAALIGLAITIGNVIIPAYIKKYFPKNVGLMTGVYSVSMNLSAALAAGYSISLGKLSGMGWKGSIGIWVFLALFAFIIWLPLVKKKDKINPVSPIEKNKSIWKSALAWNIALFMGLQSFIFYSIITWLPVILQDWGLEPGKAGWILSYVQLAQLPITFIAPVIAGKLKKQTSLVWITALIMMLALAGIIFGRTSLIIPSAILLGISMGISFSLAMMFFVLRTKSATEAATLSGMSQSIGYLLAATGPPLFGALFDITHMWFWSIILLVTVTIALLITGLKAAQNKLVS